MSSRLVRGLIGLGMTFLVGCSSGLPTGSSVVPPEVAQSEEGGVFHTLAGRVVIVNPQGQNPTDPLWSCPPSVTFPVNALGTEVKLNCGTTFPVPLKNVGALAVYVKTGITGGLPTTSDPRISAGATLNWSTPAVKFVFATTSGETTVTMLFAPPTTGE
jgi:hypothetical protein